METKHYRKKKLPQLADAEAHLIKCNEYALKGINELKLSEFNDLLNRVYLAKDILIDQFNKMYPERNALKPQSAEYADEIKTIFNEYFPTFRKKTREQPHVQYRHCYCYFMRNHTTYSLSRIGMPFNYNHTTVIHAVRNVQKELDASSSVYLDIIDFVTKKLTEELSKKGIKIQNY
jgi:chromosomal replication initiation ATPase DnaA